MIYSIIKSANLEGLTRLDPQFYQSKFIENRNRIKSMLGVLKFRDIASTFTKGIFDIKAENYVKDGIPFVRVSNLRNGFIQESNLVFIPKNIHDENPKTKLNRGDIILSKTAYPAASLVNVKECNLSQDTIGIKIDPKYVKKIKSSFIVSFLNSQHGQLLMEQYFQGNIQMHLGLFDAKNILIPILNMDIQEKIDDCFWKSNELSVKAKKFFNQAIKIIENEIGLEELSNSKTSYIKNSSDVIRSKRYDAEYFQPFYFQLKENIMGYEHGYSNLDSVCRNKNKKINPIKNFPYEEFDYVELSGINPFLGIIETTEKFYGYDAPSRARMVLQKNNIVVSSVEGSIGRVALIDTDRKNFLGSTGFFVFEPNKFPSEYVLALMKSNVVAFQIKREATGSILASSNLESLKNVIIPNIPKAKVTKIVSLVRDAHKNYKKSRQLFDTTIELIDLALTKNEKTSMKFLDKL